MKHTNGHESDGGDLLCPSVGLSVKHEHVVHGLVIDGLAAEDVDLLVDYNRPVTKSSWWHCARGFDHGPNIRGYTGQFGSDNSFRVVLTQIQTEDVVVGVLVCDALEEIAANHVHFIAHNTRRVTDSNGRDVAGRV